VSAGVSSARSLVESLNAPVRAGLATAPIVRLRREDIPEFYPPPTNPLAAVDRRTPIPVSTKQSQPFLAPAMIPGGFGVGGCHVSKENIRKGRTQFVSFPHPDVETLNTDRASLA